MKRGDKAFPEFDVEIGGDTVKVVCDWQTIYNFEKVVGRSILNVPENDFKGIAMVTDFLYAAIGHQDRKYTQKWILANMSKKLWFQLAGEIIPSAIHAAVLDEEQVEESKKETPASTDSSEAPKLE